MYNDSFPEENDIYVYGIYHNKKKRLVLKHVIVVNFECID